MELGGGEHGLLQSLAPIAIKTAGGGWSAVDLSLSEQNGVFVPADPLTEVRIPDVLSEGVVLPASGISVVPEGPSVASPVGVLDGASVFYANAAKDADLVVKPSTFGVLMDIMLRSEDSPGEFSFHVGLPEGASLVEAQDGSLAVEVVREGVEIARVPAPMAVDAAGTPVPVSMGVSGSTLTVSVPRDPNEFQYPLAVDPEFESVSDSTFSEQTWLFVSPTGGFTEGLYTGRLEIKEEASATTGDRGELYYQTHGVSKIYNVSANVEMAPVESFGSELYLLGHSTIYLQYESSSGLEEHLTLAEYGVSFGAGSFSPSLCAQSSCSEETPGQSNTVNLVDLSTRGGEGAKASLTGATVYIAQPPGTHATIAYNTESPDLEYTSGGKAVVTPNVLYGGNWLGPNSGALHFTAKDPGLGVAETLLQWYELGTWNQVGTEPWKRYLGTSSCAGVQCTESQSETLSYASLKTKIGLYDGEELVRFSADDAMANSWSYEHGEGEVTVKVDDAAPHGITVAGIPAKGEELELGEVGSSLKVEASDGEGTVKSSGVKSITVGVDGKEIGKPSGGCAEGPCTAAGEWQLNGAELGVGMHSLTVLATDKAGNVASKSYLLRVFHASPVGMGPGSVNPESGDFALEASDVDISGGAGALAVTRHYDSRNAGEGVEGPLGPDWSVSLGSLASLEVLPDGSVMTVGPEGLTHFSVKSGGGFEAPPGDSNLTLEATDNSKGEIIEYMLKDPGKGTTTRFTLPAGANSWMPTISEGPVATDTTTDAYQTASSVEEYPVPYLSPKVTSPTSIASGPDGDLWFTGKESQKIGRMLPSGVITGEYSVSGSPGGIVNGPDGNLWYSNGEHNKLGKITTSGVETEYSVTGSGPLDGPTVGPEGNIWYTFEGTHEASGTVGEMSPSGSIVAEYLGSPEFKPGTVVPGPDGNMWFVNSKCDSFGGSCTIGKMSPSGSILGEYAVKGVPSQMVAGPNHENSLWAVTPGTAGNSIVRVTTAGAVTEYLLPAASVPEGIVAGPDGNLWFTDSGTSKVGKITPSGVISEYPLHSEASRPLGIVKGPDGRLWFTEWGNNQIAAILPSGVKVEPKLELAPHSSGSCPAGEPEKWEKGCRGLEFVYDTESRITLDYSKELGENESEWGEYRGRLGEVKFIAYDTVKKAIVTKTVADYQYDRLGRLRAVWNPEISPTLKTVYGYDVENHLTGLTPAGQEPWSFTYGTIAGDASTGRLIKATRAPASAKLWGGESPKRVEAPKLSGTAVVGVKMGASTGLWSNEPVSYAYQWEDCSSTGVECSPILGASNANYTVGSSDVGHTLVARVTATNGGGSIPAYSAASAVVTSTGTKTEGTKYNPGAGSTIEYQVPLSGTGLPTMTAGETAKWAEKDDPVYATAIFPPAEPQSWPATDYHNASLLYIDAQARTVNTAAPSAGISTSEYSEGNEVTRTLSPDNRAAALKESCESESKCKSAETAKLLDTESTYNAEGQLTDTWGPQHMVRLAIGKEGKTGEEVLARNHIHYYYDEGAAEAEEKWHEPFGLVTKTTDGAETASKEEFDKRTSTTSYSGQGELGWKLRAPTSTTTDPGGLNLTGTTLYEESTGNVIETRNPASSGADTRVAPAYIAQFGTAGSGPGQLKEPRSTAIAASGNTYVLDSGNSRVQEFSSAGAYIGTFGTLGTGNGNFKMPYAMVEDTKGNLWVADTGNNRVQEFNSKNEYSSQFGSEGAAAGQFKEPKGIAITGTGSIFVSDGANNRIEKFNEKGEFQLTFGYGVSNGEAKLQVCTSTCRAGIAGSGAGQFNAPRGIAVSGAGNVWVADSANHRIEEFKENGEYVKSVGSNGTGNGQFTEPDSITIDASGNLWVSDGTSNRIQKFTSSGEYLTSMGIKGTGPGQFEGPWGIAITASGNMYIADAKNNRVQRWVPTITGNTGAGETKTIYYTAKAEAEIAACREHPEWAGLPCQSKPVAQPGASGLPELPVTTISYNIWDQPEKTEEAFGSTIRTKKTTYDPAGRPLTSEETSSTGIALPTVTDTYNTTNGLLEKKSTTVSEKTKTLTSKYNTLGQLEAYTDAEGATTTFEYEKEKAMRLLKTSDSKGNQTYAYEETTGLLKELHDSAAGTFSASYDTQGKMTSESYPNGMTAYYTHDPAGETNTIEYKKLTHCTEKCVWFSDTVNHSIHGETLKQSSTLAEEPNYTYDRAGRLLQVQEIPTGESCKTRAYEYDENSNRTTETSREPSEGKCASEGGSTEWHTYDTANTLADTGITYDPFGDTTKLPSTDAGGSELASKYYVDGQVYEQEQAGEKIEYKLDPEERTTQTISSGGTSSNLISHYDGPGGALAWKGEGADETEKWTRNIPGIDGALTATQKGEGKTGQQPILLLHDLQGNVVAEAALSETETKLLKTYNSTEFGVPNKEAPPTFAWLGADGVAGELPSGVITQDGITYVPQTGQPLQINGVALPAPENAAASFTRPIEAWVGSRSGEGAARELSKAQELEEERQIANQPPGAIPSGNPGWWCGEEYGPCEGEEGGGSGGGCSGANACASSAHNGRSQLCRLEIMVGEEHGKAWSRAWMWCGTMRMPAAAYLQSCLTMESGDGFAPVGAIPLGCGKAVIGEQDPYRLYANYEYRECPSEVKLKGYAMFWMPGWGAVETGHSRYGYTCGESRSIATLNFAWTLIETFSDKT